MSNSKKRLYLDLLSSGNHGKITKSKNGASSKMGFAADDAATISHVF